MSKFADLIASGTSTTAEPALTVGADGSGNRDLAKDNDVPSHSASLYLYVFFAVLVVVLFSSITLMIRSITNRRRQRRLFEDQIYHGTWYHGSDVGVVDSGSFDLEVPKMWEGFIRRTVGSTEPACAVTDWHWDSIKPLSVTTANKIASSKTATSNANMITSRYLGAMDVPPPLEFNIGSSNKMDGVSRVSPTTEPQPEKVVQVVATLIAMPSRSRSSRASSAFPPPQTTFSSGSPPTPATPLTDPALPSSSFPQHTNLPPDGVIEPLAYLEFGIMELVMR